MGTVAAKTGKVLLAEIEIWRAAVAVINRYGQDAGPEAARRAKEMLIDRDLDGNATWRRILAAIGRIQALPSTGAWVN